MTLIGAYVGGAASDARALDTWAGEPFDRWLGYTEGWDANNWNGLRPIVVTERAGALGDTKRPILWSIMMMTDDAGVEGYRSIARGERRALHEQIGRDLIAYHDRIGDTGPIYVRSTWEVPGEWFGWNVAATQDPDAFKGAWKEFANALHKVSSRIKTVWDFNSDRGKVEYLYPGDDVVDVISQDIYWIHDLQGRDPIAAFRHSRHGYSRGLQWHLEWCREKGKPMAISEFGIKLNDGGDNLDYTRWFKEFFAFVDEVNADPRVGMAYVTWWNRDAANVGEFTRRVGEPHQSNVRAMFKERLPGSVLGGGTTPTPNPTYPPTSTTHGTGADSLVLRISQSAYQGSAQYRVLVDGRQLGPVFTASALRSAGQSDTLTLKADFAAGQHTARVEFLNDAWGGTAATDRNLYLDAATFNGANIPAARRDILGSNEAAEFAFTKAAAPAPTPEGWQAEAQRLSAENAALKSRLDAIDGEKAALAAQHGKLKGNVDNAISVLSAPT